MAGGGYDLGGSGPSSYSAWGGSSADDARRPSTRRTESFRPTHDSRDRERHPRDERSARSSRNEDYRRDSRDDRVDRRERDDRFDRRERDDAHGHRSRDERPRHRDGREYSPSRSRTHERRGSERSEGFGQRAHAGKRSTFAEYSADGGLVLPRAAPSLEERRARISAAGLSAWDVAAPGFERVSAQDAVNAGLFEAVTTPAKSLHAEETVLARGHAHSLAAAALAARAADPERAAVIAALAVASASHAALRSKDAASPEDELLAAAAAEAASVSGRSARVVYVTGIARGHSPADVAAAIAGALGIRDASSVRVEGRPQSRPHFSGAAESGLRVELPSSSDAARAAGTLDGRPLEGLTAGAVYVRRTVEYTEAFERAVAVRRLAAAGPLASTAAAGSTPEDRALVVCGLPATYTAEHVAYLLAPLGDPRMLRVIPDALGTVAVVSYADSRFVEDVCRLLDGIDMCTPPVMPESQQGAASRQLSGRSDSGSSGFGRKDDGTHEESPEITQSEQHGDTSGNDAMAPLRLSVRRLKECETDAHISRLLVAHGLSPGAVTAHEATHVIQVHNLFDLRSPGASDTALRDVRTLAGQHGRVVSMQVAGVPNDVPVVSTIVDADARVLVEFGSTADARAAAGAVAALRYRGRGPVVSFCPEDMYGRMLA